MKKLNIHNLLIAIIICQLAGLVGALFTFAALPTWYATLIKPAISPPGWIFGPVWTLLYILMGYAFYLVWQKGVKKKGVRAAMTLFFIQLTANAAWSTVFFGLHSILGAMVVLMILWGLIVVVTKEFWNIERRAAYLMLPYLAWVSFAGILNFQLLILNP